MSHTSPFQAGTRWDSVEPLASAPRAYIPEDGHMSGNQEVSVASKDDLDVREFSIQQSMSSLFSVTVTAVSKNPDIDLEAVIGQEASFVLHGRGNGGKPKTWTGICNEFHQIAT